MDNVVVKERGVQGMLCIEDIFLRHIPCTGKDAD